MFSYRNVAVEDASEDASGEDASSSEDASGEDASANEDASGEGASGEDDSASEDARGPQLETHTQVEEAISKCKLVEMMDSLGGICWKKGRFRPIDLWQMEESERIVVRCDEYGRPKGKCSSILASWLGTVARRPNICPLTFNYLKDKQVGWRKLPDFYRKEILRITKLRFICIEDPSSCFDKFVLRSLGKKVKDYKYKLKKKAFANSSDLEEIKRSVPKTVDPFQWVELVKYWFSVHAKKLAENAKVAREKVVSLHTTGTESFACAKDRLEHEFNRPVGMAEFYHRAHVHKNGAFIDEDAASLVAKADAMLAERVLPKDLTRIEFLWSKKFFRRF